MFLFVGQQWVCPNSFNAVSFGATQIDGHETLAVVAGCGIAQPIADPYSETMLLIVIKGTRDYYTLQWAERGSASPMPLSFDEAKWRARLRALTPIKLCPIIAGEAEPYPSCLNR